MANIFYIRTTTYIHSILPIVHLWDFTRYVVVIVIWWSMCSAKTTNDYKNGGKKEKMEKEKNGWRKDNTLDYMVYVAFGFFRLFWHQNMIFLVPVQFDLCLTYLYCYTSVFSKFLHQTPNFIIYTHYCMTYKTQSFSIVELNIKHQSKKLKELPWTVEAISLFPPIWAAKIQLKKIVRKLKQADLN